MDVWQRALGRKNAVEFPILKPMVQACEEALVTTGGCGDGEDVRVSTQGGVFHVGWDERGGATAGSGRLAEWPTEDSRVTKGLDQTLPPTRPRRCRAAMAGRCGARHTFEQGGGGGGRTDSRVCALRCGGPTCISTSPVPDNAVSRRAVDRRPQQSTTTGKENTRSDTTLKGFDKPDALRSSPTAGSRLFRSPGQASDARPTSPAGNGHCITRPRLARHCVTPRTGGVLSGHGGLVYQDGERLELLPGQAFHITSAPHDRWVEGTEP